MSAHAKTHSGRLMKNESGQEFQNKFVWKSNQDNFNLLRTFKNLVKTSYING